MFGEDDPHPLQFGPFEVQDQTNVTTGDSKIVKHLSALMIGDAINNLGINDYGTKGDQVRHILSHLN